MLDTNSNNKASNYGMENFETPTQRGLSDISEFVKKHNIPIELEFPYVTLGKRQLEKGWIIEISTILFRIDEIIPDIVNFLLDNRITFQIPNSNELFSKILFGHFGTEIQNRLLIIYPSSDREALFLVNNLITYTRGNIHPTIQGSYHLLQGIYTRYDYTRCITTSNNEGKKERFAVLHNGKLVANPLQTMYQQPKGIPWIFNNITKYKKIVPEIVVGNKTIRRKEIRTDAKGMVYKGIYFHKWYYPINCIIKTGRKNELLGQNGIDAAANIEWQFNIHSILQQSGVTASPFDLVKEINSTSLVMEQINGINWGILIHNMHTLGGWKSLSQANKKAILNLINKFVQVIKLIHDKLIIHRDISPSNLFYTKNRELKILDFGLSYQITDNNSSPIFTGITMGYSDIYRNLNTNYIPTIKEDIYSIGAVLIFTFTGLHPSLFDLAKADNLYVQIASSTGNEKIAQIITECMSPSIHKRPTIERIIDYLKKYEHEILKSNEVNIFKKEDLFNIIYQGIKTICTNIYTNNKGLWKYTIADQSTERQHDERLNVQPGLFAGISGTLFAYLSVTAGSVFSSENQNNNEILRKNINYLIDCYNNKEQKQPGLMMGNYGIGMAIAQCIKNGIYTVNEDLITSTRNLLNLPVERLNLWEGLSGMGIFILKSYRELNITNYKEILSSINHKIVHSRKSNGTWFASKKLSGHSTINLASGDAGIILYLLLNKKNNGDQTFDTIIHEGLNAILKSQAKKTINNSLLYGTGGIAYVFLIAYDVFRIEKYKTIAEKLINSINIKNSKEDLSFASGLAGIGYLLLKASNILKVDTYTKQAQKIVIQFQNLKISRTDGTLYWHNDVSQILSPGFFNGNAGILYFLYKYTRNQYPDNL